MSRSGGKPAGRELVCRDMLRLDVDTDQRAGARWHRSSRGSNGQFSHKDMRGGMRAQDQGELLHLSRRRRRLAGRVALPLFRRGDGSRVGAGFATADALLMGRVLYEEWAAYWPEHAGRFSSTRLRAARSSNASTTAITSSGTCSPVASLLGAPATWMCAAARASTARTSPRRTTTLNSRRTAGVESTPVLGARSRRAIAWTAHDDDYSSRDRSLASGRADCRR
jgi:hypothetical protein